MSRRDYYDVLGVGRNASDSEIKSAYRKLALQNHPDRNPGDKQAEDRFKEAAEAYAVLADPDKRARYDRFGHAGVSGPGAGGPTINPDIFADFSDILGDFFGFGSTRRGGPARGSDLRYDIELSFDDSYKGVETTVQIPREEACETCHGSGAAPGTRKEMCTQCRGTGQIRFQQGFLIVARTCGLCSGTGQIIRQPCTTCRGTGRIVRDRRVTVRVPAGIADGQRLRIQGEGEHGVGGGPPGDLYVVVHVPAHPIFRRDGDDLYMDVAVPYPMMTMGGEFTTQGPAGEIKVEIPPSTQSGALIAFRGKGMPSVTGRAKGTLYVRAIVDVPKKLNKEQRKLITELNKTMAVDRLEATPADEGKDKPFFEKVKDLFA